MTTDRAPQAGKTPELDETPETIAPIGPADIEDALGLLRAQLDEHEIPVSDAELRRSIGELFVRPHLGTVLLARRVGPPGEALGLAFVNFSWTPEIGGMAGWLDELYVRPQHRGRGLGTRLLQAAITLCRQHGCCSVDLQVEHSHARAAGLYTRHHFAELPRRTFRLDLREHRAPRDDHDKGGEGGGSSDGSDGSG